jgi:hypothetical protein
MNSHILKYIKLCMIISSLCKGMQLVCEDFVYIGKMSVKIIFSCHIKIPCDKCNLCLH